MMEDLVLHSLRAFHNNPSILHQRLHQHNKALEISRQPSTLEQFDDFTDVLLPRMDEFHLDMPTQGRQEQAGDTPCLTLDTLCLSGELLSLHSFLLHSLSSFSLPSLFHFFLSLSLALPPPFLHPFPSSLCPSLPYSSLPLPRLSSIKTAMLVLHCNSRSPTSFIWYCL